MDISSTSALDISMCSEPAADTSFAPFTSSSTSNTGSTSSSSEHARGWKERKWIVNESNSWSSSRNAPFVELWHPKADQTIKTIGSRITVSWKCNNGHTGHWESCPNTCGMTENNLLAAAATLFTGATFTDIADWAGLLNLRLPQKTTYNNIQASYLIPVIEAAYKKQEDIIKARLICQSRDGWGSASLRRWEAWQPRPFMQIYNLFLHGWWLQSDSWFWSGSGKQKDSRINLLTSSV